MENVVTYEMRDLAHLAFQWDIDELSNSLQNHNNGPESSLSLGRLIPTAITAVESKLREERIRGFNSELCEEKKNQSGEYRKATEASENGPVRSLVSLFRAVVFDGFCII